MGAGSAMRILLVEDDQRIAKPLVEDLRNQHHIVDWAGDGVDGWNHAQSADYDLILLDLMLPRLDGMSLCRRLRAEGCRSQILMLTAKDATLDKVIGLDAGADDYLVKPFELEELSARIRALSRRGMELQPTVLQWGDFRLDVGSHGVMYGDTLLNLTPKEYLLLACFLKNPTQVFTRQVLLDRLWELDRSSGEETIKTHITNLRRKLKQADVPSGFLCTVYGVGYCFSMDEQ
jgi:two-component system, OmpR family, response regulator QseB